MAYFRVSSNAKKCHNGALIFIVADLSGPTDSNLPDFPHSKCNLTFRLTD